jgi:hypothetical protein
MAEQQEIEATYDYMDEIIRLSLGEHAEVTCAPCIKPVLRCAKHRPASNHH